MVEPLYDLINRPGSGWLLFPIAIRKDVTINVHMPTDLTKAEAEKVARVVMAYAKEDATDDA